MTVYINGESKHLPVPTTVAGLVASLDLGTEKIAVAINEEVVPRSRHQTHLVAEGDRIEIIQAVAGG